MNRTIDYYNNNADSYYEQTAYVDFHEKDISSNSLYEFCTFCLLRISGCGSGRDAAAFCRMGYEAEGLDASSELAAIATRKQNIDVTVCNMEDWIADEPYDGIWCCAALLHLTDDQIRRFFENLKTNLKEGGVLFISVKTGIETGYDEKGRYMRGFSQVELQDIIVEANAFGNNLEIAEAWETEDGMERDVKWVNMITKRPIVKR